MDEFKCMVCEEKFQSQEDLKRHARAMHVERFEAEVEGPEAEASETYAEEREAFAEKRGTFSGAREEYGGPATGEAMEESEEELACPECEGAFRSERELDEHARQAHAA